MFVRLRRSCLASRTGTRDSLPDGMATQRRLIIGIVVATLTTLAMATVVLAFGGRPDPPELRAAATLLDGPWRFRPGDDVRWADPDADDRAWDTIDLTPSPGSHDGDVGLPDYVGGWMTHGYPRLFGYAWYRRAVTVPTGHPSWEILGPTLVEDGYQIYWNGKLLGGSGRLDPEPRVVGTRPLRFALPVDAAGTRGVLAVRAYMLPGSGRSADSGGMHTAPMLAPHPVSDALQGVQWQRTIAGYVVDAIEPLAMLAVIGLAIARRSGGGPQGFLMLAAIALALTAVRRASNAVTAWTDLLDLPTYAWLAQFVWIPTVTAWTMAWNRWAQRPSQILDLLAAVSAIAAILGATTSSASLTGYSRIGSIALFVWIGARIVRNGPMRTLAIATLASIMASLFGAELLDPLGMAGIWFPFGIGVSRSQYVYAIGIPLLAILIARIEQRPVTALER